MKVLFLVNHDIVIYNFRKEIVEKLLNDGHEVYISSPNGERIKELIDMGCKYYEIEISRHGTNIFSDLNLIKEYYLLLKKISPDIVLGFTIKPNIYGAIVSSILNIPFVANITGLGSAVEKPGVLQKITVFLYKVAFLRIQTVFFQNSENKKFFFDHNIAKNKHKMLPGSGVNLEQFKMLEYPDEQTIEFVFISRIMKEKGIENYLEAAENIRGKYPNTRFHICGFCEEEYEKILEDYEKRKIIEYHGMVRDITQILKRIHCTIHPTYYPEGLSNVLLESAASGKPLITTNRSGTRETVEDNVTGYLVSIKDTNDLVKKIEKFINLTYTQKKLMGQLGRKKIEKEFDRNIVVNKYLNEVEIARMKK